MSYLTVALLSCVIQAADVHQLAPELLISVIKVEGGAPGTVSRNRNRTEDLGVMQINTGAWLDLVADAHFAGNRQLAYRQLRDDACYNIQVGAWILRRSIDQSGGDLWHGVGRYHSATPVHNQRYRTRVQLAWAKLFSAREQKQSVGEESS